MSKVSESPNSILRYRKPNRLRRSKDPASQPLREMNQYHDGSTSSTNVSKGTSDSFSDGGLSDDGRQVLDDDSSGPSAARYVNLLSWFNEVSMSMWRSSLRRVEGTPMLLFSDFESRLGKRFERFRVSIERNGFGLPWLTSAVDSLSEFYSATYKLMAALALHRSDWNLGYPLKSYCGLVHSVYRSIGLRIAHVKGCMHFLNIDLDILNCDLSMRQRFLQNLPLWEYGLSHKVFIDEELFLKIDELVDISLLVKDVPLQTKVGVLMRAMFGVKMMTLLVCSGLIAAFGAPELLASCGEKFEKLLKVKILQPELFPWAQSFIDVQRSLSEEINKFTSCGVFGLREAREVSLVIDKDIIPVLEKREMDAEGAEKKVLGLMRLRDDLAKESEALVKVTQKFLDGMVGFHYCCGGPMFGPNPWTLKYKGDLTGTQLRSLYEWAPDGVSSRLANWKASPSHC